MRAITEHRVNPANDTLTILVIDEPGAGGANHMYEVHGFHSKKNPSAAHISEDHTKSTILFQNGPIAEVGVNGVTQEVLLAIVADRLRSFQAGPFACTANEQALKHVEQAMQWLHSRTRERMARGVEGTNNT